MPFIAYKLFRHEQQHKPKYFISCINKGSVRYLQKLKATEITTQTLRHTTIHNGKLPNSSTITIVFDNDDSFIVPIIIKNNKRRYIEHRQLIKTLDF